MKKCSAKYVDIRGGGKELGRGRVKMGVADYKKYYFKDFKNIELRSCGVYGIRSRMTGETYIGSTGETFKQRWGDHIEDLHYRTHSNYNLLESWYDHSFEDFEFFILKPINYECDRDHIYRLEQEYVDEYLVSRKPLFNIILNMKKSSDGERYLHLKAKERFKELFANTFLETELSEVEIDEIIDTDINTIEQLMECVDYITPMEYEGVRLFISQNIANRGNVRWQYDDFDICCCNTIKCPFYSKQYHYCKKYDEQMAETWYKPTWCFQFYDEYEPSAKMTENKGRWF